VLPFTKQRQNTNTFFRPEDPTDLPTEEMPHRTPSIGHAKGDPFRLIGGIFSITASLADLHSQLSKPCITTPFPPVAYHQAGFQNTKDPTTLT
jgi:hypothetical protein